MNNKKIKKIDEYYINLQHYRLDNNYTQEEMAKMLNITRPHLANVESGKYNFSLTLRKKMAKLSNTPLSDWMDVDIPKGKKEKKNSYWDMLDDSINTLIQVGIITEDNLFPVEVRENIIEIIEDCIEKKLKDNKNL